MMNLVLIGGSVMVCLGALAGFYFYAKSTGRKEAEHDQLEIENEILTEAAKIKANSVNDSIATVRKRLRKRIKTK